MNAFAAGALAGLAAWEIMYGGKSNSKRSMYFSWISVPIMAGIAAYFWSKT